MSDRSTHQPFLPAGLAQKLSAAISSRAPYRFLVAIALFLTIVAVVTPFAPRMPTAGLDNSWMVAMNDAVVRRLPIGDAVIFTFGPYAGLYTQVYHPDLDLHVILAGIAVAIQCFICIRKVGSQRRPAVWPAFALAFLFFAYSVDAIFICSVMLAGLYAWLMAEIGPVPSASSRSAMREAIAVAFVFAALGLLMLVKVTFVLLDGPMLLLAAAALTYKRRSGLAVAAFAGFLVGSLGFWLLAGQSPGGIYHYIRSSMAIISGYTDAMSVPGDPIEVVVYWLVAGTALLGIAYAPNRTRSSRLWLASIVGLVLMTASKSGFVRHDFHATIAAASLCLTLFSLRLLIATPPTSAALVAACCVAFYFDSSYVHSSTNSTIARLASPYQALWNGSMRRLEGSAELRADYDRAMGALRSEQPYPLMTGTTDIYSSDQAHLIASGNRWNPRPIFQSYSAYNAKLAEINREHLAGSEAPDHVLIRIEPIDGHVPLSEDGPSWPELLSRYQPTALGGDLMYLARRAAAQPLTWTSTKVEEHAMGEPIALPDSSSIDFVSLDIRPTLLGRMVSLLFRIDSPRIVLELRDGRIHEHRVVTKSAVAGFIVSPYVESINDAVQLYSPGALAAKRVRTLTVIAPRNASKFEALYWKPRFTMTSSSFVIAGATDLSAVMPMDHMSDEAPAPNATVADCLGSLDLINDMRDLTHLETGTVLKVDGWMDQQSATVPSRDVFVTLTDANGQRRYVSTHPTPRPDVAAYLKRPELTNAGYSATADLSKLEGPLTVGMAYQTAGRLVRCRQFAIPLAVKR